MFEQAKIILVHILNLENASANSSVEV